MQSSMLKSESRPCKAGYKQMIEAFLENLSDCQEFVNGVQAIHTNFSSWEPYIMVHCECAVSCIDSTPNRRNSPSAGLLRAFLPAAGSAAVSAARFLVWLLVLTLLDSCSHHTDASVALKRPFQGAEVRTQSLIEAAHVHWPLNAEMKSNMHGKA